jgi:hypothetical protein
MGSIVKIRLFLGGCRFFKFRAFVAPQFWRVNSYQKSAAYTRANTENENDNKLLTGEF